MWRQTTWPSRDALYQDTCKEKCPGGRHVTNFITTYITHSTSTSMSATIWKWWNRTADVATFLAQHHEQSSSKCQHLYITSCFHTANSKSIRDIAPDKQSTNYTHNCSVCTTFKLFEVTSVRVAGCEMWMTNQADTWSGYSIPQITTVSDIMITLLDYMIIWHAIPSSLPGRGSGKWSPD